MPALLLLALLPDGILAAGLVLFVGAAFLWYLGWVVPATWVAHLVVMTAVWSGAWVLSHTTGRARRRMAAARLRARLERLQAARDARTQAARAAAGQHGSPAGTRAAGRLAAIERRQVRAAGWVAWRVTWGGPVAVACLGVLIAVATNGLPLPLPQIDGPCAARRPLRARPVRWQPPRAWAAGWWAEAVPNTAWDACRRPARRVSATAPGAPALLPTPN